MKDAPLPDAGWATAKTLAEALPYIQIYDREVVVIKYGGHGGPYLHTSVPEPCSVNS